MYIHLYCPLPVNGMEQYFALKPAFFVTKELQIWPIKKLLELQPQLESYIWLTIALCNV